ncbi:unnamed protein product [Caenorhabditis auriculariae]|uniref:HAT C-terminal dimerisation domain-containing protein n=1 Tax=Caenorhabditis auriculariae TaxID=2777116 RepID=A0A8S1HC34_9PELO|nr:unnamed protein product [Caenorhabditis auriculariae]
MSYRLLLKDFNPGDAEGTCILCERKFILKHGTSQVIRHFKKIHPEDHRLLLGSQEFDQVVSEPPKKMNRPSSKGTIMDLPTLISRNLARFLSTSLSNFSALENVHLLEAFNLASSGSYKLPNQREMMKLLRKMANDHLHYGNSRIKAHVLKSVIWVSLTVDVWKSCQGTKNLISVTSHFILEAFQRTNLLLGVVSLPNGVQPSVENCSIVLNEIVGRCGISSSQIGFITSTYEFLLPETFKAHNIPRLAKQNEVLVNLPPQSEAHDWQRVFVLFRALNSNNKFLKSMERDNLTSFTQHECLQISFLCKLLESYANAMDKVAPENASLSIFLPAISKIRFGLQAVSSLLKDTSCELHPFSAEVDHFLQIFCERTEKVKDLPLLRFAVLLDPRFAFSTLFSPKEWTEVCELFSQRYGNEDDLFELLKQPKIEVDEETVAFELASEKNLKTSSFSMDELHSYKALIECGNRLAPTDCPFSWWNDHSGQFPGLSAVAKEFLAIPPSAINSERVFEKCALLSRDSSEWPNSASTVESMLLISREHDDDVRSQHLVDSQPTLRPESEDEADEEEYGLASRLKPNQIKCLIARSVNSNSWDLTNGLKSERALEVERAIARSAH